MSDAAPRTFQLGELKLTLVSDGGFGLDGGAMFGVVPKNLWNRVKPADEQNRIPMQTNCLLVERGDHLALIDTGLGDHHDARFRDIFGFEEGARRLPDAIRAAGYELGDVTHVLMTHLHFDHCGWNCTPDDASKPTFPGARYVMSRGEVAHARSPNERDRASYNPRNWEPLFDAGRVDVFDGQAEPLPGIRMIEVKGHNENMCIVRLDGGSDDAQGVFWADLVPTAAHVPYPWIMGYDLFPLDTLAHKKEWLPRALEGGWLCFFEHEHAEPVGRLQADERGRLSSLALDDAAASRES